MWYLVNINSFTENRFVVYLTFNYKAKTINIAFYIIIAKKIWMYVIDLPLQREKTTHCNYICHFWNT